MSQEILYTSAPQGLKPGSRGFCTVASTASIAKNLLERLESFSGYRHAFMAHEAQAAQNPVNYAHYHTTVGGRKYHILSRVADAGLDYTQRSNKLAHHVALEPSETENAPGGPAWVMATPGFFVDQWDGQVQTWPVGREPPASERPTRGCRRWQTLTGDAGWGGVLAESALRKGSLMSVIFPAGTPVLELVVESLSLLPQEKRWDVTFSTYFTKAPAGVDCQWRFLLDGTPEATALRRDVRAAVIDLCQPLGQAEGGELVQAARSQAVTPRSRVPSPESLRRTTTETLRPAVAAPQQRADEPKELKLAPLSPTKATRPASPVPAWLPSAKRAKRKRWLPIVAGTLLLVLAVGVSVFIIRPNDQGLQVASLASIKNTQDEISPPAVPLAPDGQSQSQNSAAEPATKKLTRDCPVDEPADPKTSFHHDPPMAPRSPSPFKDIRKRLNKLQLPPTKSTTDPGNLKEETNRELVELAKLFVRDADQCSLRLLGRDFESRDMHENHIAPEEGSKGVWRVWSQQTEMINKKNVKMTPIARLTLRNGKLLFNWELKRPVWDSGPPPFRFACCSLEITAYGMSETCMFESFEFEHKIVDSVMLAGEPEPAIDLDRRGQYPLRLDDDVILELKVRGIEADKYAQSRLTMKDRITTLLVPVPPSCPNASDTRVSCVLSLEGKPTERLSVRSRLVAKSNRLSQKKQTRPGDDPKWELVSFETGLTEKEIEDLQSQAKTDRDAISRFISAKTRTLSKRKQTSDGQALSPGDQSNEAQAFNVYRPPASGTVKPEPSGRSQGSMRRHSDGPPLPVQPSEEEPKWDVQLMNQLKQLDDFLIWCEEMRKLREDFPKKARLDYRLYLRAENRDIDLVSTSGFLDASSSEKARP